MALQTAPKKDHTVYGGGGSHNTAALIVRIVFLGLVIGVAATLTPILVGLEQWLFLIVVWAVAAILVAVYATSRAIPLKYLTPGTLLLILFVVVPILITVRLSFTNYGDGTRSTKDEAITRIIGASVVQTPDAPRYNLSVGTEGSKTSGPFTFFLVDPDGKAYSGDADGLTELNPDEVTLEDRGGKQFVSEADGYTILTPKEVNAAGSELEDFTVPTEGGAIRRLGISEAFEGTTTLEYDESADTITNTETGAVYSPKQIGDREFFVDDTGKKLADQSWKADVGLDNYKKLFTDETILNNFLKIFAWTVVFATLSVITTFALGLALAVTFNDPRMRFRKIYRALLIMPYAIPAVISILLWSSFYNRDFGLINDLTGLNVNWFGNPWSAKFAVLLTNLWMGWPYMFLVSTGALQSISGDLKEAATIDGAGGWKNFSQITFPLLLVSVAPLLVATFAFNFNNYNMIRLLTEGGPFPADNPSAGGTDILISYTMRLAFGTGGAQIGFASAVSVVLFVITGVIAAIQFRATRGLEDVN